MRRVHVLEKPLHERPGQGPGDGFRAPISFAMEILKAGYQVSLVIFLTVYRTVVSIGGPDRVSLSKLDRPVVVPLIQFIVMPITYSGPTSKVRFFGEQTRV